MFNDYSNRATWLMLESFLNTNDDVYNSYLMAESSKQLQRLFYKYAPYMENGEELLDLRHDINWEEILDNRE